MGHDNSIDENTTVLFFVQAGFPIRNIAIVACDTVRPNRDRRIPGPVSPRRPACAARIRTRTARRAQAPCARQRLRRTRPLEPLPQRLPPFSATLAATAIDLRTWPCLPPSLKNSSITPPRAPCPLLGRSSPCTPLSSMRLARSTWR
ncbi:hypothetical protein BN2497_3489 [Janthinobacterium sp. CG23_2]|nr:hypothetical protein BN2497_3489 [Janthinobacterium sp. CG23_2]CUU28142.1 hypothetical protein BN3177_3489 [Janthinobacterium sp. CG23_2]